MGEFKSKDGGFYLGEDEAHPLAEIDFHRSKDKRLVIDHTFVHESLKGQGVGGRLVEEVVAVARREKLLIVPLCPFARKVLSQAEAYADLLAKD